MFIADSLIDQLLVHSIYRLYSVLGSVFGALMPENPVENQRLGTKSFQIT